MWASQNKNESFSLCIRAFIINFNFFKQTFAGFSFLHVSIYCCKWRIFRFWALEWTKGAIWNPTLSSGKLFWHYSILKTKGLVNETLNQCQIHLLCVIDLSQLMMDLFSSESGEDTGGCSVLIRQQLSNNIWPYFCLLLDQPHVSRQADLPDATE